MPRMWMSLLDRTGTSQNQHIRRQPSRIPLPREGLSGGRAMENKGMKITVVGLLVIAGVVLLLALLVHFLRNQSPEHGSNSQR